MASRKTAPYPAPTLRRARVDRFLDRTKRVLVVGELILDRYILGKVGRISPEAPVPVVEVTEETLKLGGAANVASNLREFVDHVDVLGLIGKDTAGTQLRDLLAARGLHLGCVLFDEGYATISKTRIIARHQQLMRIDREKKTPLSPVQRRRAVAKFKTLLPSLDAVILEDYAKGLIDQELIDTLIPLARAAGKIVAVDPKPANPVSWHGMTSITPNRAEAFQAAGIPWSEPVDPPAEDKALRRVGELLLRQWDCRYLLITLSEQGMALFEPDGSFFHIPTRAQQVFDVSGAGDTAIALFTAALAGGATPIQAAEISNHASGIVVGKVGTATVSREELLASFPFMNAPLRPAVFLDRDGTLMREVDYCRDPALVELLPGVREGLEELHSRGYVLAIISNQSGIGRGRITLAEYEAVHARLLELLGPGLIEGTYFCPDHPEGASERRKPAPGMVLEAARDLSLDLARSWLIGDKAIDLECARRAGVWPILVQTGYGATEDSVKAEYVAADFFAAVEWIIKERTRP